MTPVRTAARRLGVALAALLIGCSAGGGFKVDTDYDPTISFASLRTYEWLPERRPPRIPGRGNDPFLEARLRTIPNLVEQELVAKGFRKETAGRPDFLVTYNVATRKGRINTVRDYGAYRSSGGTQDLGETYVSGFEEGALTIDIVDPTGTRLLWRSTARAVVDDNIPTSERQARLQRAVRQMLEPFPPR